MLPEYNEDRLIELTEARAGLDKAKAELARARASFSEAAFKLVKAECELAKAEAELADIMTEAMAKMYKHHPESDAIEKTVQQGEFAIWKPGPPGEGEWEVLHPGRNDYLDSSDDGRDLVDEAREARFRRMLRAAKYIQSPSNPED